MIHEPERFTYSFDYRKDVPEEPKDESIPLKPYHV